MLSKISKYWVKVKWAKHQTSVHITSFGFEFVFVHRKSFGWTATKPAVTFTYFLEVLDSFPKPVSTRLNNFILDQNCGCGSFFYWLVWNIKVHDRYSVGISFLDRYVDASIFLIESINGLFKHIDSIYGLVKHHSLDGAVRESNTFFQQISTIRPSSLLTALLIFHEQHFSKSWPSMFGNCVLLFDECWSQSLMQVSMIDSSGPVYYIIKVKMPFPVVSAAVLCYKPNSWSMFTEFIIHHL